MLIAENISYAIKKKSILKDIHFNVLPGEFLAVIGPNGAGKSTLLKILCGELQKYTGRVALQNQNIAEIRPKQLALKRAVLSQNISLTLPFRVSEVVMMGRYPHFDSAPTIKDLAIVQESLELTGMLSFMDRNYLTLSGGEKQRVHLARVLAQLYSEKNPSQHDYKILFLDEPVNGLDLKYQQQVMKVAREWMGGNNSVVSVLHDLNLAAHYADRILLLHEGNRVIIDTPEKVLTKEHIQEVYDIHVTIVNDTEHSKLYVSPVFDSVTDNGNIMSVVV